MWRSFVDRRWAVLLIAPLVLTCSGPTVPAGVTPSPIPSSTLAPATATAGPVTPTAALTPPGMLTGVNLATAVFGEAKPGVFGKDYTYPSHADVDYFLGKGMNVFRIGFTWENLQHEQFGDFEPAELARLDDLVRYATSQGGRVVLDPHDYARYYNEIVGGAKVPAGALADLWGKLARQYADDPRVIFGLMNEPNTMPTELWLGDANAAIDAIRAAGATNLILVPGNSWTGAHSWEQTCCYGTPNGQVMLGVVDPAHDYAFEVHEYLDEDTSGTHETCVSPTIGSERLKTFTTWLREHGQRGFLGEFAGARNDTCYAALDDMLGSIDQNGDVWLGWTYWAAGPWWGEYMFTLEPLDGVDRPQMAVLLKHIPGKRGP
jgi:endoglucanase